MLAQHDNGCRSNETAMRLQGIEVEREARRITVNSLVVTGRGDRTLDVEVVCSKGTYVRVLAEEIAAGLGTRAHPPPAGRRHASVRRGALGVSTPRASWRVPVAEPLAASTASVAARPARDPAGTAGRLVRGVSRYSEARKDLFAFGLDDFAATIKAVGADMVTQMGFARGRLNSQRRVGQEIV